MGTVMGRGPLEGIRVVEWTHMHMGSAAGMFMSDMGADVVHIEQPGGDGMRHFTKLWGHDFGVGENRNTFTEDLLRNKRSAVVDLNQNEDREMIHQLIRDADVFVTNYRPAAVSKHKLDYETVSKINPGIIYAHGTAYGPDGPERDSPGLEMMGLAKGGLMLSNTVEGTEPGHLAVGLNDRLGGIGLLVAVLSALVHRERTGEGQLVETSLLGWAVCLQASAISCSANTGQNPRPLPRDEENDPVYSTYRLKDGTWTALGMGLNAQAYWPSFCEALGRSDLTDHPRFRTLELREENRKELIQVLDHVFSEMTWEEWDKRVHAFDLISCRVNGLTDLSGDEQILANNYLSQHEHPELGEWWYVPTPIKYGRTPTRFRSVAPHAGQHTHEIRSAITAGRSGFTNDE